ncbi:MAG: formimidoylglutamate deiminase [Burkholderiaceae bacterium]
MRAKAIRYAASQAWVQGRWAKDVLLEVDASGHWSRITTDAAPDTVRDAVCLAGPVLPGVVNAHSHAFQRAIAGMTEQGAPHGHDNFWSWRERMYAVAQRITPDQLEAIATLLYTELLTGGYTQVCEFHYLHNACAHAPQASALEMSMALVRAAQRSGIGLTLLPTLYMRSGFAADGLRPDQQRFASTPDSIARLVQDVQASTRGMSHVNLGVALHSLRAVTPQALAQLSGFSDAQGLPIHIHIAEQPQEVQDCIAQTGQRPIEWLLSHAQLHARWNLVHATHATQTELDGVRASGASIVICPSTEANLGDGVFDYGGYCAQGGSWSVGSDSHVSRAWNEELRLLEYGQRLTRGQRNVAAQSGASKSSAANMLQALLQSGQAATALPLGGLKVGQRADFVVLDAVSPAMCGLPSAHVLDAHVFSSPGSLPLAIAVGGRVIATPLRGRVVQDFAHTLQDLLAH